MISPVLYSTNVFLKFLIQQRFRKDIHFVWCCEFFDSTRQPAYSASSIVAPSSNPSDIYRQLKKEIEEKDRHSYKINEQKASLTNLAIKWESVGEIRKDEKDEIVFMVNNASFDDWRPLIYVIPRLPVEHRLKLVPIDRRASFGIEYIIDDLERTEFDVIEI